VYSKLDHETSLASSFPESSTNCPSSTALRIEHKTSRSPLNNNVRHSRDAGGSIVRAPSNRPLPQNTSRRRDEERVAAAVVGREEGEIFREPKTSVWARGKRSPKARVVDGLTLLIGIVGLRADEEGLVVAILHQLVLL
jgi:hypothetical protein